ncbi:hypothetical protein CVT24_009771 [Panaeolus cyanescens]|uniref:P-loop containing nucleoside triphosphate hydrolase protein n=1 Tax=Panaeolus cyanescens TaxID=181874 RepID=A0A409VAD0_9AGAR|nr:hypothetical protein CVT24_009771 [Panaeolus cyanescens]
MRNVSNPKHVLHQIPDWIIYSVPLLLIFLSLLRDLTSSITLPKPLKASYRLVSAPFRNFLTLDDLLEPVDRTPKPTKTENKWLVVLAAVGFLGWTSCLVYAFSTKNHSLIHQSMVFSISWWYITLRISFKPALTPPYLFISFAITSVIISLVNFGDGVYFKGQRNAFLHLLAIPTSAAFVYVAGTLPLKTYRPALNVANHDDTPSVSLSCPEDNVNLWNWSAFTFVQPILDLAMQRTLNETDVWTLSPFFRHKNLFHKYLAYKAKYPTHSLLRFLLVSNSLDLILDIVLELWSAVIGFVPPYALQQITSALASDSPDAKTRAYYWTLAAFLANLSFAQVDLFQCWYTRRCYERTRGQLFCALHYKSLKRQEVSGRVNRAGETKNADLGKLVNLMQVDAYAVAQRFWDFSGFFTSPVRLVIALLFLYRLLGWSAFAGVVVVLMAFLLTTPLAKINVYITKGWMKAKDERMNRVNELLQNIRFLKFYGWEYQWSRQAQNSREEELKWRVRQNINDTAINFIWNWMPAATSLTTFLIYTQIAEEKLNVEKAFTALALFSMLQSPMIAIPGQFVALMQAHVSMKRIEEFLQEDEVPEWASTLLAPAQPSSSKSDIGFEDAAFEWEDFSNAASTPSRFHLGPLNVKFPIGKLTIVSGPTGSGKSALLSALLGEMHCTAGRVIIQKVNHQVAFCAQNPWLEHATIRDNIVFGSPAPFDETRYQSVLDACALRQDLAIFAAGDMTEIGEKGITLSGGQRARIALARAMYSQAKYILLDDPLAAVDMHTALHLVQNCLNGKLAQGRTIILVTHHITLCLPVASYLVELDKGSISYHGTIPELQEQGVLHRVIVTDDETPLSPVTQMNPRFNEVDNFSEIPKPQLSSDDDGKLIDAEARAEGRVSLRSYLTYVRAAGMMAWVLLVVLLVLLRLLSIADQVFLKKWSEAYEKNFTTSYQPQVPSMPWDDLPSPNVDVTPWLKIYLSLTLAGAIATLAALGLGYYSSLQASRTMFLSLLKRLTRAPARFFDVTPIGRILNRFTGDINTIDHALQNSARLCFSGVLNFIASFSVILYYIPHFAPFAIMIAWLYIRLAPSYIQASRDLRRLESVALSPAFAGYDELLRGIAHIRAFAMENRYQDRFYTRVDNFQSYDHAYWLVSAWLRWRYDCLGSLVVVSATLFALWSGVSDGSTALIIAQAGIFADASRQLVKVAAQLELDFNSVERVVEYFDVPQEAPAIIENKRPPAYWPSNSGQLVVEDLVVQYAPHLPAVLHNLKFTVKPAEKIGVVGRTGSGKSTLAMSLLRMVEPTSGKIMWVQVPIMCPIDRSNSHSIDGIDITTLGLEDLRTRITIVSQDVSLFSGTIRSNLDPLGQATNEECLQALERCHLLPLLNHEPSEEEPTVLDMKINQGSLSAGEKQLLALARATLRRTNIIIMDEATSQIDSDLDDQIQETIREELAGAIVITIAHRLKTVMDYDRILVLNQGHIAEFDTPKALLAKPGGIFQRMCRKNKDLLPYLRRSSDSVDSERSSEGSTIN